MLRPRDEFLQNPFSLRQEKEKDIMIPHIINIRKVITSVSITRVICATQKQITKIIKANEITPKYFFIIPTPYSLIYFTKL